MRTLTFLLLLWSVAAEAAHPVFDLVANRTLAHVQRGAALSIAAGSPGFARYIHFSRPKSWDLRQVEDGRHVALAHMQAILAVPLDAAEARGNTITIHLKSPVRQSVRAIVGGKALTPVALVPGWQTVQLSLPPGALVAGENNFKLGFANSGALSGKRASAAVEWIDIGAPSSATAPPTLYDGGALVIDKGNALTWYAEVPAGGALQAQTEGAGCELRLAVLAHGGLHVEAAVKSGAAVDLSRLAGKVVRLSLQAPSAACKVKSAALLTSGERPTVKRGAPPRNVVFWMSDTTRSDKFRVYNPKSRVETPVIDALAKAGTTFEVAYVQGNESRVSHASLWTSLYPAVHNLIPAKAKLNPKFVTLPEAVKATGRTTLGLMGNGFIDNYWGFGRGWDLLRNHIHDGGGLRAENFVAEAKATLQKITKPYFLYIGTIDAHVSYRAHEPWLQKYDPKPYQGAFLKSVTEAQVEKLTHSKAGMSDRDKERVIAIYDSDISYNDHEFGELQKLLDAKDTMIIYTADHGEELWEHGKMGHGQSLREELVHVPLVISYPPLFQAGKKVAEGVEIIDLMPTIVDALGGKIPADAQGESLIPLAQGAADAGYPRPAIASQYELAHTMRLDRWKLWVGGSGDTKLYDAKTDALERHEISTARPFERRFVEDAMGMWMAYQKQWKKSRWGVASNNRPDLARDLETTVVSSR